jgi:hypothetical protein
MATAPAAAWPRPAQAACTHSSGHYRPRQRALPLGPLPLGPESRRQVLMRNWSLRANENPPDVTQSCGGFAPGVTGFPIDRIRQAIQPTEGQITFLNDLAAASSNASAILNTSCPNEPPLTLLGRLDALERRLEATIRAIEIVRPALANLYDSLSDEQRQRLDAIGADERRQGRGAAGSAGPATLASLCSDQSANFTRLPAQRIEEIVKPTGQQQSALEELQQASAKAADQLRASCPAQIPETPMARLDSGSAQFRGVLGCSREAVADKQHPTEALRR